MEQLVDGKNTDTDFVIPFTDEKVTALWKDLVTIYRLQSNKCNEVRSQNAFSKQLFRS